MSNRVLLAEGVQDKFLMHHASYDVERYYMAAAVVLKIVVVVLTVVAVVLLVVAVVLLVVAVVLIIVAAVLLVVVVVDLVVVEQSYQLGEDEKVC